MKKKYSISVFFPCYNDAESIQILVKDAYKILKKYASDFEIIVIDDGSTDNSRKFLRKLKKEIKLLKLVFHKANRGYGGALKSGFNTASKEFVFYTDGDGQYDVKEIKKLIDLMDENIDLVQGYKIKRHDPWIRLLVGSLYHHFSKTVYNLKVKDIDCDFRLIRKSVLEGTNLRFNSGVICVELMKKLEKKKIKFKEVGVNHYPRLYGTSQFFNFRRVSRTLLESIKLWFTLVVLNRYD